jgi:hypothetical protein
MCVTLEKSKMAATIVGGGVNYKARTHFLLYKNAVQNLSGRPNAMPLPIMGEVIDVRDTTSFNKFMDEIVEQTTPQTRGAKGFSSGSVKTYQVGAYTILEAEDATPGAIMKAIRKLPQNHQPVMEKELLEWYKTHYGNPTLLLCCFTGAEALNSQPIMVEYEPRNFNSFLVPGADDHHGMIPNMGGITDRDHTLIFGQYKKPIFMNGRSLNFSQNVPIQFQNASWESFKIPNSGVNCDWVFQMDPTSMNWQLKEVTTKEEIAAFF